MNASLGPWTTAIDSGSTAALSAFWKQRIRHLPELAHHSPRVSRRAGVLLALAGVLAIGWPTAQLSRQVAAASPPVNDEASTEGTVATHSDQQPGQPLVIDLGDDVRAELLGMSEHPSRDKPWWAPDGSPIEAPYQEFRGQVNAAGATLREIAVRWHLPEARMNKPAESDITPVWDIPGCSAWAGYMPKDAVGYVRAAAFALQEAQETVTIKFSIAAGPWTTVAETNGKNYWSQGKHQYGYIYTPAVETGRGVNITISHNVLHRDLRIVAVDAGGKVLADGGAHGGGASDFIQSTGTFDNLKLKDVAMFQLQARPFHRFEVRNVALHPNQHTQPEIVDLGLDEEVVAP